MEKKNPIDMRDKTIEVGAISDNKVSCLTHGRVSFTEFIYPELDYKKRVCTICFFEKCVDGLQKFSPQED